MSGRAEDRYNASYTIFFPITHESLSQRNLLRTLEGSFCLQFKSLGSNLLFSRVPEQIVFDFTEVSGTAQR